MDRIHDGAAEDAIRDLEQERDAWRARAVAGNRTIAFLMLVIIVLVGAAVYWAAHVGESVVDRPVHHGE